MTDVNDLWRHDGEDVSMVLTGPPAHSPSDLTILRESRARPERFAELFDAYHGEIYRYVASRLSAGHADDLAAETFLVAFHGRGRFDGTASQVRAWLYGIATNLIRRHRRDEDRRYRAFGRAAAPEATHIDDDQVLARVAARGVQPELAAALRALKPGDRDVLLLVALGELNYAEVALALGIAEGTVASRLNRARKTVRAALGGANPTHDDTGAV